MIQKKEDRGQRTGSGKPIASDRLVSRLEKLQKATFNPLDLVARRNLDEKLIELDLLGPPEGPYQAIEALRQMTKVLDEVDTSGLNVVVFGGGTGLSNVIGGDSRRDDWPHDPFLGLKELFPKTRSIVCVTDDGGSTGELLKDLPIIGLGDLRHVLLSSIQERRLLARYGLGRSEAAQVVEVIASLFNCRFVEQPSSIEEIERLDGIDLAALPEEMRESLYRLLASLFTDSRLVPLLQRPHCLGNLLLVAAILQHTQDDDYSTCEEISPECLLRGIRFLAEILGASPDAVLPCTTTPAQLMIQYANGVLVTGEYKSGHAKRGYPVDRVFVAFADEPHVPDEVLGCIKEADIIVFAPGSLYTSIIPIMQLPGITDAVRDNDHALKILVANFWVQRGETDLVREDPGRRFYVSDLLQAYHRNIPGGVKGLFEKVLTLSLQDIQGSILQSYALERKIPIYLDRGKVWKMGFMPVEARIFSKKALEERRVVQHDPDSLARAIRTAWTVRGVLSERAEGDISLPISVAAPFVAGDGITPNRRLAHINARLNEIDVTGQLVDAIVEILWAHGDIPVAHLDYIAGVRLVERSEWRRSQEWDNIFSFFEPADREIKIREDVFDKASRFEVAFLVALGQSLLGNYAGEKAMLPVEINGGSLGKAYQLTLRQESERDCFFSGEELAHYLALARMNRSLKSERVYTRLVAGQEGFTPPGLLFGLTYAWYLDNRFAPYIDYKMAIDRTEMSDLIPEQKKILSRRWEMVDFFRTVVFRQASLLSMK